MTPTPEQEWNKPLVEALLMYRAGIHGSESIVEIVRTLLSTQRTKDAEEIAKEVNRLIEKKEQHPSYYHALAKVLEFFTDKGLIE